MLTTAILNLHGNGGRLRENAIGSIRWSIRDNLYIETKISQISFKQAELEPFLSQISLTWQLRSIGKKCNWQHSMPHPPKPT